MDVADLEWPMERIGYSVLEDVSIDHRPSPLYPLIRRDTESDVDFVGASYHSTNQAMQPRGGPREETA